MSAHTCCSPWLRGLIGFPRSLPGEGVRDFLKRKENLHRDTSPVLCPRNGHLFSDLVKHRLKDNIDLAV